MQKTTTTKQDSKSREFYSEVGNADTIEDQQVDEQTSEEEIHKTVKRKDKAGTTSITGVQYYEDLSPRSLYKTRLYKEIIMAIHRLVMIMYTVRSISGTSSLEGLRL